MVRVVRASSLAYLSPATMDFVPSPESEGPSSGRWTIPSSNQLQLPLLPIRSSLQRKLKLVSRHLPDSRRESVSRMPSLILRVRHHPYASHFAQSLFVQLRRGKQQLPLRLGARRTYDPVGTKQDPRIIEKGIRFCLPLATCGRVWMGILSLS